MTLKGPAPAGKQKEDAMSIDSTNAAELTKGGQPATATGALPGSWRPDTQVQDTMLLLVDDAVARRFGPRGTLLGDLQLGGYGEEFFVRTVRAITALQEAGFLTSGNASVLLADLGEHVGTWARHDLAQQAKALAKDILR